MTKTGSLGTIFLRGPQIQKSCAEIDQCGYFNTGDLGFLHSNGKLSVKGIMADKFMNSDETIFPACDIERLLASIPCIYEVRVVADTPYSPIIAFITLNRRYTVQHNITPPEIVTLCNEKISQFHLQVQEVKIVDSLQNGGR